MSDVGGGAVLWLMFVGPCTVRSNASWVMVTLGAPHGQTD